MKKALMILALLSLCVSVSAQTVVSRASKLQWDDPNPVGSVTHFRVYVQGTPGVVPDGTSFVVEIVAPIEEWTIDSDIGSWWAVVTAVNNDGTTVVESGPSNEVHYIVIGPPVSLEIVR